MLYSHPEFPTKGPGDINMELMNRVSNNPLKLLLPQNINRYVKALWKKKSAGQPVTFTDIFGMLIGETLLPAVRYAGIQTGLLRVFTAVGHQERHELHWAALYSIYTL